MSFAHIVFVPLLTYSSTFSDITSHQDCYNMSEEDKKYLDDECDKIDFMSIVQSVGLQIKVSTVDTRILKEKFLIHISCKMHDQLLSVSKITICSVSIGFDLNVNSCKIYTISVCDHTWKFP